MGYKFLRHDLEATYSIGNLKGVLPFFWILILFARLELKNFDLNNLAGFEE